MSIKACELMVEAQKNPEKYEGKKYKTTFWDILDGYGKSHKEIIVKNGRLHFTDNDNLKVYINDYNELEEIKPEPKPVTFMEAVKANRNLKVIYDKLDIDTQPMRLDELMRLLRGFHLAEIISNGTWYIIEE